MAQKEPPPVGEEELTAQSQAEGDATTANPTKKLESGRKRRRRDRSVADLGEYSRSVGRATIRVIRSRIKLREIRQSRLLLGDFK